LGVSAEKVVATIETPSNHQGIFRPERKNSVVSFPERRATKTPMPKETIKNKMMIVQSNPDRVIVCLIRFENL